MSRVVLGKRLDGTYGFDVSLSGIDALTGDRMDANKFSFSSDWANRLRVHTLGVVDIPQTITHGLAYIPHVEVALIVNGAVYDDKPSGNGVSGTAAVFATSIWGRSMNGNQVVLEKQNSNAVWPANARAICIIFRLPVS